MNHEPEQAKTRPTSLSKLEQGQRRHKAFVDRQQKGNEQSFGIDKAMVVFQTRLGLMQGSYDSAGQDPIKSWMSLTVSRESVHACRLGRDHGGLGLGSKRGGMGA